MFPFKPSGPDVLLIRITFGNTWQRPKPQRLKQRGNVFLPRRVNQLQAVRPGGQLHGAREPASLYSGHPVGGSCPRRSCSKVALVGPAGPCAWEAADPVPIRTLRFFCLVSPAEAQPYDVSGSKGRQRMWPHSRKTMSQLKFDDVIHICIWLFIMRVYLTSLS